MMTAKQKWFLEKLMKEVEELGYTFSGKETFYGSNGYNSHSTTSKEASQDISMLLKIKELVAAGKTADEAFDIATEELFK